MIDLNTTIKKEKETATNGRFTIEPLPAGYGMTVGTALRRVLLSSLPGGAITEIKVQGAPHPFATIKGVQEDVVEIVLNLKKVRFQLKGDGPFEGTIEAKGKGTVKASDIKISSESKVVNGDLKLATLTDKNAKLTITVTVERGMGYRPAEEHGVERVGIIPMDATFSPVTKVAFTTEGTRVGRKTNLDKLILDIETDGTIKPSDALKDAAQILTSYFGLIAGVDKKKAVKEEAVEEKENAKSAPDASPEVRKAALSELKLSPRTLNTLESVGIKTVGGLMQKSESDLAAIKGFGATGIKEVKKSLAKLDAALKE